MVYLIFSIICKTRVSNKKLGREGVQFGSLVDYIGKENQNAHKKLSFFFFADMIMHCQCG